MKKIKTINYIELTIDRLPKGYVFSYADCITEVNKKEAVIKALNRMAASGKIAKLSKGKFYKPEETPFGNLLPTQRQVVKDLLEENGKTIGYLTGYSIYNQLGLTNQVSNTASSCKILLAIIRSLSDKYIKKLVRLALKYPPATRALLGALLDQLQCPKGCITTSEYKVGYCCC